jgi:hypothetical protein
MEINRESEAETAAAREALREQLLLYAENYHSFVLQVLPRLDLSCSEQSLQEICALTDYYRRSFAALANQGERLATLYYQTSTRLQITVQRLLGLPQELEDLIRY